MRGSFLKGDKDKGKSLERTNSSKSTISIKAEKRERLGSRNERSESYKESNSFIYVSTILELYKYKPVFFYTLIIYSFLILI